MYDFSAWVEDLTFTARSLSEETLLLEMVLFCRDQNAPFLSHVTPQEQEALLHRLCDFLRQHAFDLDILTSNLEAN